MKQYITGIIALMLAAVGLAGCQADSVVYDGLTGENDADKGQGKVMFADSAMIIAIQNSTDWHDVVIGTTRPVVGDRHFGIEVVAKESNAIEGLHYTIESPTVTIKDGENTGVFRIKGNFDNMIDTDSIGVTLRLVNKDQTWDMYGDKARVTLQKVCPFSLDTFTPYCRITSQYFDDYMQGTSERIVRAEKDPETENGIILRDFFYKGNDLRFKFNTDDPLEPLVEMEEGQVIGTTAEAFGTQYGDKFVRARQASTYTSFFNVCQHYVILYTQLYVKNVGTVGTYLNVLEFISKEEAEANGVK